MTVMISFMFSLLLVLMGIIFWKWYMLCQNNNKLPPGPTPFPFIGSLHLLGKLPHRTFQKLSQKYGSIMSIRLGSVQAIIVSSPEAAKIFLRTHDAIFASRPKFQASKYISYDSKGIVFTPYGPYLRDVRKFCKKEFLNALKINAFAEMRKEELGVMVEEIRVASMRHEVVNLRVTIGRMIEAMTCRTLFGRKTDERFNFTSLIDKIMDATGVVNLGDYVPILSPFDLQGLNRSLKSLGEDIDKMLESLIDEHENCICNSTKEPRMSFIDVMLSQKSQYSIDKSSVKAILLDMIGGAIGTSKSSIEWVLSALTKNPRVMKELQRELSTIVGDKKMVEEKELINLNYLNMVIKETFRQYPVAPLLGLHASTEDIVISGYHIPKNSSIFVNFWAFGRDSNVWSENCQEFLPERFRDIEVDLRGHDFQLIPFGSGRRACPGMDLGLIQIGLTVAHLVHCFDWDLPNGISPNDLSMHENLGLTMDRAMPLLAIPSFRS